MRLFAHLLRTDARRFRLLIIVLLALPVLSTVLEIMEPAASGNPRLFAALATAGTLVWIAELLLGLLLIAQVVQAHPLVGSDAFWMTRPIPPLTLMASKIVLLFTLTVVMPLVCDLGLMRLHDVPAGRMAAVAVQSVVLWSLWSIVFMVAASLTRTLAGFVLLWSASLVIVALAVVIGTRIAASAHGEDVQMVSIGVNPVAADDATSSLVLTLVLLATGLVTMAVQYTSRLRRRSVPAAAAGTTLALGIATFWPWPVLQAQLAVPDWARSGSAPTLSLDASRVSFEEGLDFGPNLSRRRIGRGLVALHDLAPGWLADVGLAQATLVLEDGTRIEARGPGYVESNALDAAGDLLKRSVLRDLLGVTRLVGLGGMPRGSVVLMLRETEYRSHKGKPGTYSASYAIDLTRAEIAGSLRLEPGASYQEGADRFVVTNVRVAESASVRVRRSGASTIFDRAPRPMYEIYLRNRRLGEATATWADALREPAGLPGFFFFGGSSHVSTGPAFGFGVDELVVRPSPSFGRPDEALLVDEDWIADADLVIVRLTRAGRVIRGLEVPDFPLRELDQRSAGAP